VPPKVLSIAMTPEQVGFVIAVASWWLRIGDIVGRQGGAGPLARLHRPEVPRGPAKHHCRPVGSLPTNGPERHDRPEDGELPKLKASAGLFGATAGRAIHRGRAFQHSTNTPRAGYAADPSPYAPKQRTPCFQGSCQRACSRQTRAIESRSDLKSRGE
jgi:hypothetical protein